jgi:hypothetical protein
MIRRVSKRREKRDAGTSCRSPFSGRMTTSRRARRCAVAAADHGAHAESLGSGSLSVGTRDAAMRHADL